MADENPPGIAALFAPPPDAVIETHISTVFLSGDRAWKLKKAVAFPYLDFSSLARREDACRREVELNRRTAPQLYLGVRAVRRDRAGRLSLDGAGETVDWLVEMRRFDPERTFDRLAVHGELVPAMIDRLADTIARFHATAAVAPVSAEAALAEALAVNDLAFRRLPDDALPQDALRDYRVRMETELARLSPVLAGRQSAGRMRRGHGDLHLRNIALIGTEPVLFDCLEFDDTLATCDTLYDLAFLLMDLLAHDRRDLAGRALNRYLDTTGDYEGVPLLPVYVALRAAIRCHIAALQPEGREQARRYLALARNALRPGMAMLAAIGGFSGSGKSTVARGVAPALPGPCGAVILRSDAIRKQQYGVAPTDRLSPDSYTQAASDRVYARLGAVARQLLVAGCPVILDAVFGRAGERVAAQAIAAEAGVGFAGFWLDAPESILLQRVVDRRDDASDAGAEVVRRQVVGLDAPADWTCIDAAGDSAATIAAVLRALPRGWRRPPQALE
jgi:aminoglycoside phosphotransferase family enzyme/predicted kinase